MCYITDRAIFLFFLIILVGCNSLSIGTVSDIKENVTVVQNGKLNESQTNGAFFPDWVPFKNKHGEQLGEFIQVPKSKPKKRLALPMNFVLKPVAEAEGDDYYEKAQGDSDNEEYFEKKDWSDLNRNPSKEIKITKPVLNHTEISDIDGVVSILENVDPNQTKLTSNIQRGVDFSNNESDEEFNEKQKESEIKDNDSEKKEKEDVKDDHKKPSSDENYDEEDVPKTEKPNIESTEKEKSESEIKKANILNSVDELKERHAKEQKILSEKEREEERYIEDLERDNKNLRKPSNKYDLHHTNSRPSFREYEDDDDTEIIRDKYRPKPRKTTHEESTVTTTPIPKPRSRGTTRHRNTKNRESGKLSVFKNPRLYMMYDDTDDIEGTISTTIKPYRRNRTTARDIKSQVTTPTNRKISSRYSSSTTPDGDENTRIAFVPQKVSKEGEPTLFFAKKRKNKRKRVNRIRTTTPKDIINETEQIDDIDSETADTIPSKIDALLPNETLVQSSPSATGISAADVSAAEVTVPSDAVSAQSAIDSAPSGISSGPSALDLSSQKADELTSVSTSKELTTGADALSTNSDQVADALPSSSDHKKEEDTGPKAYEKAGEKKYHSEVEEEHGEQGKKAYKGLHKESKTAEGHHDKEDHHGVYDDHGGHNKHHHHEGGHYGEHHHEESGKKHAKYEESGKHSKGHNTKGSHDIHKKEEYEKKVEFFEEDGDSAEEEKHGGYNSEKEHSSGGHFKKGNLNANHEAHAKGESGHFGKGGHAHGHKAHKSALGHDAHGRHGQAHFHKEGKDSGKKWIYHHGFPAKTANLIIIDRRGDQYQLPPYYHG